MPSVTVLQLDTQFPRIPGDVACPDTYLCEIEIVRVASATVKDIVSDRPDLIDINPFETALKNARGDIVVTSCGFLSYWQNHLADLTQKTFISSSLIELEKLSQQFAPGEILTLTFDHKRLSERHFGEYSCYAAETIGLPPEMHLRQVISRDSKELDTQLAAMEMKRFITKVLRPQHKHIVLECTNLPPYKPQLQLHSNLKITDILTCIECQQPGSIKRQFLT